MNLTDIIERAKKACPGWKLPGLELVDNARAGQRISRAAILAPKQSAAIILASIKEWMVAHQPNVPVEFTLEA